MSNLRCAFNRVGALEACQINGQHMQARMYTTWLANLALGTPMQPGLMIMQQTVPR